MMKTRCLTKITLAILISAPTIFLSASSEVIAQNSRRSRKTAVRTAKSNGASAYNQAMAFARQGKYAEAAELFFKLSLSPRYVRQRPRLRYLLGVTLSQLGLHQTAAFQFIGVIKGGDKKYATQALQKLSVAANELGDETLLNYAISRMSAGSFPAEHRDMLFYRIGEFQVRNKDYEGAIRSFNRVAPGSPFFEKAQYQKAYAYAVSGRPKQAVQEFEDLIAKTASAAVTDDARVAALMGRARALYQIKDWDSAIAAYREVPKDSPQWHDTLFESSWAMLRSGRFRSALSNFQSLHSPYYEDTYLPESLLLRSIVYLYICEYDEMEKVLNLYNRIYRPVFRDISAYVKSVKDPQRYFVDVVRVLAAAEKDGFDPRKLDSKIPYVAVQKIIREGDFQRSYDYIKGLMKERAVIQKQSSVWQGSGLGKYAKRTVERRLTRARARAGRQIRAHLLSIRTDLIDLFEQEGFIRYEMINGQREALKKKVAGKDLPSQQVNQEQERDFYVQNGYQYWTFRGEYWLDELGNYHYVGTQSCQ